MIRLAPIKHPRCSFMAVWREGRLADGKLERRRKYFTSEKKARAWIRTKSTTLARGRIEEGPPTAEELAAIYEARRSIGSSRIIEAIRNLAGREIELGKGRTVAEAVEGRLAAAKALKRSRVHVNDLNYRLRQFKADFGPRLLSELTTAEVQSWILALDRAPGTLASFKTALASVFTWAIRLGWIQRNPAAAVTVPEAAREPVEILTPAELGKLLEAAAAWKEGRAAGVLVPALAIGAFAGLRRSEIERLDWSHVRLDRGHIVVFSKKTRTASRRLVTIEPALAAWIRPHAKEAGRVIARNSDERRRFNKSAPLGRPWPANALRHSFASYHLAISQNAAKTALELGHRDTAILFQHYREVVTAEEAAAFWALRPA